MWKNLFFIYQLAETDKVFDSLEPPAWEPGLQEYLSVIVPALRFIFQCPNLQVPSRPIDEGP